MTDLRHFDLNLLVAFEALMAERNVTRAAQRVRLGQPAMSHALGRLRDLFGDELFIRSGGAMQPTPRALELAGPIGGILSDIRRNILSDRAFRPEVAETEFRIGATDYAAVAILPDVLAAIRAASPKVRIVIRSIEQGRAGAMLESGLVDLAIGYFHTPVDADQGELLFHEEFDCVYDAEACGVTTQLDLSSYAELPHISMSLCDELREGIDAALTAHGLERFVFTSTPHVLTIPFLLQRLKAVAAVPRRLARHCREVAGLRISPMPIAVGGFDVSMHWHARTEADPAQLWLRRFVREAARAAVGRP